MEENLFPKLSREIDKLGRLCGDIIRRMAGDASFDRVEQLRQLVRKMHDGDENAGREIRALLADLDEREIAVITRGFTIFLELANLAEDRRRVRVLRDRKREPPTRMRRTRRFARRSPSIIVRVCRRRPCSSMSIRCRSNSC